MSPPKRRPAVLWCWYHGGEYRGFQRQPGVPTVQETLTRGLATLGLPVEVMPSGRTDRGVHARMQVISLRLPGDQDLDTLAGRLAEVLPPSLGVVHVAWAPKGFHAQWSAVGKEYRYRLCPGTVPPDWQGSAWALREATELAGATMDVDRLSRLLPRLVGTRDFFAFHEGSSPRKLRTIEAAELVRHAGGALLEVRLRGDAFARYMVRYLVGGAVAVASGVLPEERLLAALEQGEEIRGLKAPGHGLILWEVKYPAALAPFGPEVPAHERGPPCAPPFAL